MKVTIELDFENEPTRYEVYNYLLELMEDKSLCWEITDPSREGYGESPKGGRGHPP